MKSHITRTLVVLTAISLAGTSDLAQAWQTATPQWQNSPVTAANSAPTGDPKPASNASDPNSIPAPAAVLPDAPTANQDTAASQDQSATSSSNDQKDGQKKDQKPVGTAAAEKANTKGGAASKPAGTALAGAKQKQSRGLLIKVGAVLAAGAALGTVYALSRSTTPVPPGAIR